MRSGPKKILIAVTALSMFTGCAFGAAKAFEAPAYEIYAASPADAVTREQAEQQLSAYRDALLARGEEEFGEKWAEMENVFAASLTYESALDGISTQGDVEKVKFELERTYSIRKLDFYIAALLEDESIRAHGGDAFTEGSVAALESAYAELNALEYDLPEGQDAEEYFETLCDSLGKVEQETAETVTQLRTEGANEWYDAYCAAAEKALSEGRDAEFFRTASQGLIAYESLTDYDKALIEDAIPNSSQEGQHDKEGAEGAPVKDCDELLSSMKTTWTARYTAADAALKGTGADSRTAAAALLACFDEIAAQHRTLPVTEGGETFAEQADALVESYKTNVKAAIQALGAESEDTYVKDSIAAFVARVEGFTPEGSYGDAAARLNSVLADAEKEIARLIAADEADDALAARLNELLDLAAREGADRDALSRTLIEIDTQTTEKLLAVTAEEYEQDPKAFEKLLAAAIAEMEKETAAAVVAGYKASAKAELEAEAEQFTLVPEEERSAVVERAKTQIDGVSAELSGKLEAFLAAQKATIDGYADGALETLGLSNSLEALAQTYKGQLDAALAEQTAPSQAMGDIVKNAKDEIDDACAASKPQEKTDEEFLTEVENGLKAIVDGAKADMALLKLKEDAIAAANAAAAEYPAPTEEMEALSEKALADIGKVQTDNPKQAAETDEAYRARLKGIYDGIVEDLKAGLAAESALKGQLDELESGARAELDALKAKYSDLTEDEMQDVFEAADQDIEDVLASRRADESAEEFLGRVETELDGIVAEADSALEQKSAAKKQLHEELLGKIEEAKEQADTAAGEYAPLTPEMEKAVQDTKDELDAVLDEAQGEMTDDEYRAHVEERIEELLDGLDGELAALKEQADREKELGALLDEAKAELKAHYDARLDHNHYLYSAEGKTALKGVYDDGVAALDKIFADTEKTADETDEQFKTRLRAAFSAGIAAVDQQFEKVAVTALSAGGLRPDKTGIKEADGTVGPTDYPADSKELWGIVSASDGLDGNDRLTLARVTASITELEGRRVEWAFAIVLTDETPAHYTVKLLLPAELRSLGEMLVAFRNEDGSVETFAATLEDGKFLVFETTHFSDFYLLGAKTGTVPADPDHPGTTDPSASGDETDLTWLIVVLAVVLGVEAVVIVLLLLRRNKNKTASVAVPALLLAVAPAGAIPAIIVLGVLDAIGLAVILFLLLKGKKGAEEKGPSEERPAAAKEGSADGKEARPAAERAAKPAKAEAKAAPAPAPRTEERKETAVSYGGGPDKKRKKKNDTHRKNNARRKKLKSKKH